MKTLAIPMILLLAISGCARLPSTAIRGDRPAFEITVDDVSNMIYVDGVQRPIYTLMIGDPTSNERRADMLSSKFGSFAIDGTIYTRYPGDRSLWFSVFWRMPKGEDEERAYFSELSTNLLLGKSRFYGASVAAAAASVLPVPFDKLTEDDLRVVASVVRYQDGTMRLSFEEWNDVDWREEVSRFVGSLQRHYDIRVRPMLAIIGSD